MTSHSSNFGARAAGWLHRHFLLLLVGAYGLAIVWPAGGKWLNGLTVAEVNLSGGQTAVNLPTLLLMALLFNGGLGLQASRLRGLLRNPLLLAVGLVGNFIIPVLFILILATGARLCGGAVGLDALVTGLALIAAVPVAAGSVAWAQRTEGDLALSLGLVLFSTCLSPVLTPATLRLIGCAIPAEAADGVRSLTAGDAGGFLVAFVVLPTILGLFVRSVIGEPVVRRAKPWLSLLASVNLLVLNYSNAAATLPRSLPTGGASLLVAALAAVVALCALGFGAGWVVGRLLGGDAAERRSLMFGLGMNNNGTGLVMASAMLPNLPGATLPVLLYTLVQHIAAGLADRWTATPRQAAAPVIEFAPRDHAARPAWCFHRLIPSRPRPVSRVEALARVAAVS